MSSSSLTDWPNFYGIERYNMYNLDVSYWNSVIYKNKDGTHYQCDHPLNPQALWEEFQVQSHPVFRGKCYSHIPDKWVDDVRIMLTEIRKIEGVDISQIKEKWCSLVVSARALNEEDSDKIKQLVSECVIRLQSKGVYPITMEDYVSHFKKEREKNGKSNK